MWNTRRDSNNGEDDSWEVRAFAEDTADILGPTWPPRSYTCSFCRREFRSAQALGGHMNVHRRDRARLRCLPFQARIDPYSSSLIFPAHEFVARSGLCLLYSFPSTPRTMFTPMSIMPPNGFSDSPSSAVLSVSPYAPSSCSPSAGLVAAGVLDSAVAIDRKSDGNDDEELDLELRLGHRPLK